MNIDVLPDGRLELALEDDDERDFIRSKRKQRSDEDIVHELMEPYWTNGGFELFNAGDANPFVGLSSAPCIAESMTVHDDGTREIIGRFWYFDRYCLDSMANELLEHGRIVFDAP